MTSVNPHHDRGLHVCSPSNMASPRGVDTAKSILYEGRQLWLVKRSSKTEVLTLNEGHGRLGHIEFQVITRLSSAIIQSNIKEQ
jgi:hypothetical protein